MGEMKKNYRNTQYIKYNIYQEVSQDDVDWNTEQKIQMYEQLQTRNTKQSKKFWV